MPANESNRTPQQASSPDINRGISRRRFIKTASAVTLGLTTSSWIKPHEAEAQSALPIIAIEQDKIAALQTEIEDKFGVKLNTVTNLYPKNSAEIYKLNAIRVPTSWNLEDLQLLDKTLASLPAHFSSPRGNIPLTFLLSTTNGYKDDLINRDTLHLTYADQAGNNMSAKKFNQISIVNLLTERLISLEVEKSFGVNALESVWFDKYSMIFKGGPHDPSSVLVNTINDHLKNTDPSDTDSLDFFNKMSFSLNSNYAYNGITIGSEYWYQGEDKFRQLYGEILPADKLEQWVDFMKNTVYQLDK